jgi:hypothetical protein
VFRLLETVEPGVEVVREQKLKTKKVRRGEVKGIDASLIFDGADQTDGDHMGTLNGYAPLPTETISLAP